MHAQGVKIIGSIVVISTKIAKSQKINFGQSAKWQSMIKNLKKLSIFLYTSKAKLD